MEKERRSTFKEFWKCLANILLLYCSLCLIMMSEHQQIEMRIIQFFMFFTLFVYFLYPFNSEKITRVFVLGCIAQLLIFDISNLKISDNIDFNVFRVIGELIIFIVFCSILRAVTDFPRVIKIIFYSLIAILTYLFTFVLGSYNCIDQVSYELYQYCIYAFSNFEKLKSSSLNILLISISLFEALSNGIELFQKWKRSRNNIQTSINLLDNIE